MLFSYIVIVGLVQKLEITNQDHSYAIIFYFLLDECTLITAENKSFQSCLYFIVRKELTFLSNAD